jgi:hypothetical protein
MNNKLIEKLAVQSLVYVDTGLADGKELIFSKEKFAEMIIGECADICNKIYFERYPDAEDFERSEEGDAIKQHFGVQ